MLIFGGVTVLQVFLDGNLLISAVCAHRHGEPNLAMVPGLHPEGVHF